MVFRLISKTLRRLFGITSETQDKRPVKPKQDSNVQKTVSNRQDKLDAEEIRLHGLESLQSRANTPAALKDRYISHNEDSLTKNQAKALKAELNSLYAKSEQHAKDMGEITHFGGKKSKNGAYHDRRERQIHVENRIRTLEEILSQSTILESNNHNGLVRIGSIVTVHDYETGETEQFQIVSTAIIGGAERMISAKSPVGSALLGRSKGTVVKVNTPTGLLKFKIIETK